MIQRILAIVIGSAVTFALLIVFDGGNRIITDRNTAYLVAILLGGVANFFWPVIIGWRAARRIKERRDNEIQAEVSRQVADQNRQ